MQRFLITDKDGCVLKLYYENIDIAKQNNPNAKIELYNDYSHYSFCNAIVRAATETLIDYKGRVMYKIPLSAGYVLVRLYIDNNDDTYYDYCEYQQYMDTQLITPITFTMSTPKEFCMKYLIEPIKYEILSFRKYGEDKLTKPVELKSIKQAGSIDFIPKKCRCEYFVKGNDIYIKHHDYFSPSYYNPEDVGTPLEYRCKKYGISDKKSKFIYPDSWGAIVLRQEAWIKISNVLSNLLNSSVPAISNNILRQIEELHGFKENSLDIYWTNMFNSLLNDIDKSLV